MSMSDVWFSISHVHCPMTHVPCTIFLPIFCSISCLIFTVQSFSPIFRRILYVQFFVRFCSILSPIFLSDLSSNLLLDLLSHFLSDFLSDTLSNFFIRFLDWFFLFDFSSSFLSDFCALFYPTVRCLMFDVWCSMSYAPCPMSNVRFSMFDIWCLMSYLRCLLSYRYWDNWDGIIMTRITRKTRGWLGWHR